MDVYNPFPFFKEDVDLQRVIQRGVKPPSLFETLPMWRDFFGLD